MRIMLSGILALLLISMTAFGQVAIDNYEYAKPDTNFTLSLEGGQSSLTVVQNTSDKQEGTSSMEVKAVVGAYHPWGSYAQLISKNALTGTQDWSSSDSISIWIKVKTAPTHPEYMVFRIHITDKPTPDDPLEEYIYENTSIIDAAHDWVNLKVPLLERNQPGTDVPDSTGFILAPTSWGGFTYNNKKLDRDKIFQWNLGIITTGWTDPANIPADSIEVLFDGFTRFGLRAFPVTIFNGVDFTLPVNGAAWSWGQSTVAVEQGAGPLPKTNAIKWVQGDEWANGWTGWGVNLDPTNMIGAWAKDSLKFKMKCDTGTGNLRVQLEGGGGKRGYNFDPIADNAWHSYVFALKDFIYPPGEDPANYSPIDSGAISVFGIMAEATAKVGKVIRITDIWVGNPVFDVIPPDAPTGLSVVNDTYANLILWQDVAAETQGRYNVYWDYKPWTSPDSAWVKDIPPYNVAQGIQLQTHVLRSPVTDQDVTIYYGVVAKDESGNVSDPAMATASTNKAKGVPIIKKATPNFTADGNLSEWSSITPFNLSINSDSHVNPNGTIDNDNDCSAKAYVAMDNDNLYIAFDVTDDVVDLDTTGNNYEHDAPDFFIGLYDFNGKFHTGLRTGDLPDYHFRFGSNRILLDNYSGNTVYYPGANYIWKKKTLTSGYTVEAKIPFARLNEVVTGNTVLFVPASGMRMAIDFEINDRDNATSSDYRDGMLCYSKLNDDNSWGDQWRWTYTWYDATTLGVQDNAMAVGSFELSQNYPNPFNPSTEIHFSLAKDGFATLTVYDVLGRQVATLVDGFQSAGRHTVTFNGTQLASGMYLYKLDAGSFSQVKKMMLMK